jgi:amino acid transporter
MLFLPRQEAINPKKDVPFAIIASLLICTALYICVSLVLTGMMHYTDLIQKENIRMPLKLL